MASLPAIEIFVPQALRVLHALSERPQGGGQPELGKQCEVNLPKLLEILQESGLGGEGMQILTELFTPHFQSSVIGVEDFMCSCHALINHELMTNPNRLTCALVNTTTRLPALRETFSQGIKPLRYNSALYSIPPGESVSTEGSHVDRLASLLYQEEGEGDSHRAGVGRNPQEILQKYLGIGDEDTVLPSKSHSFRVAVVQNPTAAFQSLVYTLTPEAVASIKESRNAGLATFLFLAPDEAGNLTRPGHACLALPTQGGDIIFHTNYQNPDDSVFYVGITGEGVLSKFTLDPASSFSVQEPYTLSTHTIQAHHGALAHLEYTSLVFLQEAYEQFSRCRDSSIAEIPDLIKRCQANPAGIPELMPQIFQKLQPSLEILFPPAPSPA
jgi:hypothetical protein